MAKPAKPAAAKKDDAAVADAPKSKKKLIIIAVLAAVMAGGAGWYFMKGKSADHEAVKVEVRKEPIFIPLEAFTVNLQREEADQYLQVNISLKVFEPELVEKIKAVLPEIRSKLNLLLSSKRPSELAMAEGKKKLAVEIAVETNNVLGIHVPVVNAAIPASSPVAVPEGAAVPAEHEKPAEDEAATAPAPEVAAEGEAASAPVAAAPAAHAAAPAAEQKGVVDVLFTSFIIQ